MSADATEALSAIRSLVEQAKGVPMTSNVLVPRAEVLELLDRAESAVAAQGAVPGRRAEAILEQARAEAEGIVAEARGRAEGLVSETEVSRAAEEEALAFKHEADTWVDGRLVRAGDRPAPHAGADRDHAGAPPPAVPDRRRGE